MRSSALRIFLYVLPLILVLSYALPSVAIEYGGIGGRPAFPRDNNPRTESIFIHEITPGKIIEDAVMVINNTQETKTLLVYGADSAPATDGGYACRQLSEKNELVGRWIRLDKKEVTLDPVTSEVVPFTITVPKDVEVGEYNGCILIQEKKIRTENKPGVNLSFRTGLRLALTVPGKIIRALSIEDFSLINQENGNIVFHPTVKNSGNVSVEADVSVKVKSVLGQTVAAYGGVYSILRENASVWNFEFKRPVWGGWFTAQTFVQYNDGSKDVNLQSKTITFFSYPTRRAYEYTGLALLPFMLTLMFFAIRSFLIMRKRRSWIDYIVQHKDNVEQLAKKHKVSWKTIAAVNRLKPPYALKPGTTIKVPPKKQ